MAAFQNALEEASKAIQTKLDDLSTEKVNNLEIGGRNLFVEGTAIKGKYVVQTDGTLGDSPMHKASDFIEVQPNQKYIFSTGNGNLYYSRYAFYDESYSFIIGDITQGAAKTFTFKSPNNAKYVRVSSDIITGGSLLKLEKGNKATDWTPAPEDIQYDYEAKIENAADSISLAVYNKTLDELNPATELKLTSSSIKLTVADDIATAKNEAISAAATDATNKVNGLKADLSGTGIDIEAGILTLYSGVKGGNPGGKIIIAGDNFSVDANGKLKAVDGEFNGTVYATDGEFSGTIDAVSGYLGNLTMKENGYIKLPPTWMEGKYGVINNNGIEMVYSGYNSQSINWNVGVFGEYAGKISTNVNGRLQLSSTFGIGLGLEYLESISDAITITYGEGFHHNVNFNTSILSNIRELNQLGLLKFVYNTYTLYSGTIYSLGSDTTLMVLTYVGSGAQIFRLTTTGSTPLNGEVRIIVNAGTNRVIFNKNHVDQYGNQSNLKIPSGYGGGNFELHEGSCVFLVYYGGYWLLQVDRGQ